MSKITMKMDGSLAIVKLNDPPLNVLSLDLIRMRELNQLIA